MPFGLESLVQSERLVTGEMRLSFCYLELSFCYLEEHTNAGSLICRKVVCALDAVFSLCQMFFSLRIVSVIMHVLVAFIYLDTVPCISVPWPDAGVENFS